MREEYNSALSTPTEGDKIGRFGRFRYIGETQISARYIGLSLVKSASQAIKLQWEKQDLFELIVINLLTVNT